MNDFPTESRTVNAEELYNVITGGMLNLMEQVERMNRTLAVIAEALDAIASRLSNATALDNQD